MVFFFPLPLLDFIFSMILCIFKIWCETVLSKLYKEAGSPSWVSPLQGFGGDQEEAFEALALHPVLWPHPVGPTSRALAPSAEQLELATKHMELSTEVQLCVCVPLTGVGS